MVMHMINTCAAELVLVDTYSQYRSSPMASSSGDGHGTSAAGATSTSSCSAMQNKTINQMSKLSELFTYFCV